ncbi:diguanylate cyclase [Niveibacterium sp. SC-1]|uniref:diguanylate cyclase n=1 Tax=Niveibacterium sp. SC-1 TaxID=3135646 RepID=UPI00311F1DFA
MLRLLAVFAACLAFAMPCGSASAETPLFLRDSGTAIDLWSGVSMLADPTTRLGVEDVLLADGRFGPPQTAHSSLGMRRDAVWLKVPIELPATDDGEWMFNIDYPALDRVDLYILSGGRVIEQIVLGRELGYSQRPFASRTHAAMLKLLPGAQYELLMRAQTGGAMVLPMTLSKPSVFHARALDEQMLQGLLTGLALCLIFYSFVQWVSVGEHLFAKYVLMTTGSTLFSMLHFGIGAQYVWTDNLWVEQHAGGLSALIAACGSFLFIEEALSGPRASRWFGRVMRGGSALMGVCAVLYALDLIRTEHVAALVSVTGPLPALLGLPGAIKRTRQGDPVGASFLIAWVVYFFSTAVVIALIQGKVGVNFWTQHSFQIGATLDMLLFMRVLSLRIKAIHEAAMHATRERDAMHSLAHTDPLTGLANRRHLERALVAALPAREGEALVAVYMIDLDGFKPINDRYGHDVGDELLVAVAGRIRSCMRNSDLVARAGGDEFVIMANGLKSPEHAHELGLKLLSAFGLPFELRGNSCRVGLTVGYALAPADGNSAAELLKAADVAMYAGKTGGRNCLRRSGLNGALGVA